MVMLAVLRIAMGSLCTVGPMVNMFPPCMFYLSAVIVQRQYGDIGGLDYAYIGGVNSEH